MGESGRTIGLFGATLIGVGAIVGGGILALAGVAFAAAGPGAIVAFMLNGVIALLTALTFAELSSAFPQSGGSYTFAKKVFSVRSGFTVGWVVWFASIVAGVLYALGFAAFAVLVLEQLWGSFGNEVPAWLGSRLVSLLLALSATTFYTLELTRQRGSGRDWATIGKVVVFAVLLIGGLWVLVGTPVQTALSPLRPFFPQGFGGVFQAMGFTFIALQGFDLIAAAAGEIKSPSKTVPRAMLLSIAVALMIYLPLLLVVATVGVEPGDDIASLSFRHPETVLAVAAQTFLGSFGYWLVVVAALLSMLSALRANLFAASRIALSMARDRTMPRRIGRLSESRGSPVTAILVSGGTLILLLFILPDVAAAGAAASLIFLVMFSLTHWIGFTARRRADREAIPFKAPFFPLIPVVGGMACAALAIFQGLVVPSAGLVTAIWILLGVVIYLRVFAKRARALDALAEARDPYLVQLRGRNPLVLVPIANPANAEAMVTVASAFAPPTVGRVLLLSVVPTPDSESMTAPPPQLLNAQAVLRESLTSSFRVGLYPEALTTVSTDPWGEIARVAKEHACESLLLGLSDLGDHTTLEQVNRLVSRVDSDVIILRTPKGWQLSEARRVLVPVGGKGDHEVLRARLLGNLGRQRHHEVTYVRVVPTRTTSASVNRARRALEFLAEDEESGTWTVDVLRSDHALDAVAERAQESDLVVLGLQRAGRREKMLGKFARTIARYTDTALIMISRRG
ncbi:MAG: amino acid permease [Trueperaceae bacterium]|nr:MAG: amino acid permease [Trueperaceae bacterium]